MSVVLDAGAFLAVEKGDRRVAAMLRLLQRQRVALRTSAAVVAQVWRDGRKQALLARLLDGVAVRALGAGDDRRTGELVSKAGTRDVIDAHLALVAEEDDLILTSDPEDLKRLLATRHVDATVLKT